jgi:hypothetical protein
MKSVCALLALLAILVVAMPSADAGVHVSKGTILSVDARTGRIVMTQERGTHLLAVNGQTRIFDETGAAVPVASLRTGDFVREECVPNGRGAATAAQIRLLRPAWMETTTPGM